MKDAKKGGVKMFSKRGISLIIVSMFVLAVGLSARGGEVARTHGMQYKEAKVNQIYEAIRQAGAVYQWEQQTVSFQNEGMNLVCTLVIPKTPYKPPIAITMNGFGEDRFYIVVPSTGGEYFYERVSRILAEQGIATLRIDYRGSGDSDGTYDMTTLSTQISDALAAIDYVSLHLRRVVDWKNIGLLGFSQGGLVASVAASRDRRVDSLALWSAVASPPFNYESLFKREGLQSGLDLPDGGVVTISIYVGDVLYGNFTLGKKFFTDIFSINPVAEIRDYQGPMLYVAGLQDTIVWPQPNMGQSFLKNHDGFEKLVVLDTDHEFNTYIGPDEFDKTIYWTAAWFLYTLD
jgi:pimeloyl-ACP methyl ester carboxylesterase